MKISTPKNINDVLQNSTLIRIVEKANFVNDLNIKIQKIFPEAYQGLYRVVNFVDNQLIINVQNATVRQGLILQSAELLRQIQAELPEIQGLEFKISPSFKSFNF